MSKLSCLGTYLVEQVRLSVVLQPDSFHCFDPVGESFRAVGRHVLCESSWSGGIIPQRLQDAFVSQNFHGLAVEESDQIVVVRLIAGLSSQGFPGVDKWQERG